MEHKKVYTILTIHIVSLILLLISRWIFPWMRLSNEISLYSRIALMAIFLLSTILMLMVLINESNFDSGAWFLLVIFLISAIFMISIAINKTITATGNILIWALCVLDLLLILVGPIKTHVSEKEEEIEAVVIKEPKRVKYMETEDELKNLKKEDQDRVIIEELKEIDVDEEVKEEKVWEKKEKKWEQKEKKLASKEDRKNNSKKRKK